MKKRIDQIEPGTRFIIEGGIKTMEIVWKSTEWCGIRPVGRKGAEDEMRVSTDTEVEVVEPLTLNYVVDPEELTQKQKEQVREFRRVIQEGNVGHHKVTDIMTALKGTDKEVYDVLERLVKERNMPTAIPEHLNQKPYDMSIIEMWAKTQIGPDMAKVNEEIEEKARETLRKLQNGGKVTWTTGYAYGPADSIEYKEPDNTVATNSVMEDWIQDQCLCEKDSPMWKELAAEWVTKWAEEQLPKWRDPEQEKKLFGDMITSATRTIWIDGEGNTTRIEPGSEGWWKIRDTVAYTKELEEQIKQLKGTILGIYEAAKFIKRTTIIPVSGAMGTPENLIEERWVDNRMKHIATEIQTLIIDKISVNQIDSNEKAQK